MRARRRNGADYPFDVTTSPAKRLILLYGLLTAVSYLYVPFTSDLGFPGPREVVFSVVVYGAIVWGLWRGSAIAWTFAAVLDVLGLVSLWLLGIDFGLTLVVLLVVVVGQLVIIFTPSVRAHAF
jgi:hypothetical protein